MLYYRADVSTAQPEYRKSKYKSQRMLYNYFVL